MLSALAGQEILRLGLWLGDLRQSISADYRGTPRRETSYHEFEHRRAHNSARRGLMTWGQDVRFAFRMTGKKPWFSAAIVATLALGMGVNTTVFSLVNAVLYKPLPFRGGDRLVMVSASNRSNDENT